MGNHCASSPRQVLEECLHWRVREYLRPLDTRRPWNVGWGTNNWHPSRPCLPLNIALTRHLMKSQLNRTGMAVMMCVVGGGGGSAMLAVTSDHTWSATWLAAAGATPTAHNITNYRPTTSSSDVNCAYDFGLISINDSRQSADKSTLHALCHSNDLSQNDRRKSSGLCFGYWFMLNGLCFRRSPSPGVVPRSAVA